MRGAVSSHVAWRRGFQASRLRRPRSGGPEAVGERSAPTAIEINIPPLPRPLPPVERMRPAVAVVGEFGTGTVDTVTDPLPRYGPRDYASPGDLQPLGEHLGRDRSRDRARVVSSSVRRGPGDGLVLHTVLVQRSR